MIEFTSYQKKMMAEHHVSLKFWFRTYLIRIVLIVCMGVLFAHTFREYPDWVGNFAIFGIVAYIFVRWIGIITRLLLLAAFSLSKFNIKIEKEYKGFQTENEIKSIETERKLIESSLSIPMQFNVPPLRYYSYLIIDVLIDIVLFVELIACGYIALAAFHAIFIPSDLLYAKISKIVAQRFQNVIPSNEEENEGIDDLADKLFYGAD